MLLLAFTNGEAGAQGVTTAAVSGRVTDAQGQPIPNIQIQVISQGTGVSRGGLSNSSGRFFVSGLPVGGPYRIEISGLGYASQSRRDVRLALGQNLNIDVQLEVQAVEIEGITAMSNRTVQQLINPNRTGAEQLVTEYQIQNLPTITRNFTDFIQLSPLVGAGGGVTSVGGSQNRMNNIQIDGAISQDLFGLGSTGQPGGQANARSISIDAVQEYQVLAAPYDVRQAGFTGGLINAVTKSGTNDFRGSIYGYFKNESLLRKDLRVFNQTTPVTFGNFNNPSFGGTLGGPIIKDRLHFFVAGEFEDNTRPPGGVALGREDEQTVGVKQATAQRFVDLLEAKGVETGVFGAIDTESPKRNLFGRLDFQINSTHALTVRHNYASADDDVVTNRTTGSSSYALTSYWYSFTSRTHSTVAQLNSSFKNGMFNEMTIGINDIKDRRAPNTRYPEIQVQVRDTFGVTSTGAPNVINRTLFAGAEFSSQANELDQNSIEFTNNFSFSKGSHRITLGVHNEYFKFRNLFGQNTIGQWVFNSLADFEAGRAARFTRNIPYTPGLDINARPEVNTFSVYGQTEWTARPNVTLTFGLRYDHPTTLTKPENNPAFSEDFPGRDISETGSGNGILSPRFGFNWDVFDDKDLQVRGGAGVFTGRFPYVWLSNIYTNNGLQLVNLNCSTTATVPAFTIDPSAQPTTCNNSSTIPSPARAAINLMDPDFQYPHTVRVDLAVDKQLPFGIVGTAEVMYTRYRKNIFLRELNLRETPLATSAEGRPMFGTIRAGAIAENANNNSIATPERKSTDFLQVVEMTNSEDDNSFTGVLQLQKRYSNGWDLNASYTTIRGEDRTGLTSSVATSGIGFNPVKGHPNDAPLMTSDYQMPHKIIVSVAKDVTKWATVSAFYVGNSGDGYTFTVSGDVNADGYQASNVGGRNNDLTYVPRSQSDITLTNAADYAKLDAFIESLDCLRDNRGKILDRNECSEPWRNRLDARATFRVPTVRGQRAEIYFDVFNVLNLVNEEWGESIGITNPTIELLDARGYDVANNRPIYRPAAAVRLVDEKGATCSTNFTACEPAHWTVFSGSSRWQAQLGFRYAF